MFLLKKNLESVNYTQVICIIRKKSSENQPENVRNLTLNTCNFSHINIDVTFGLMSSTLK